MKKAQSLPDEIHRLKRRIEKLLHENKQLRQEAASRSRYLKNATGFRGERFVRRLLKGSIPTIRGSAHDLKVAGKLLEIKTAECRNAIKGREGGTVTKRWTWHRPLGTSGENHYHYLVLVGDIDSRYRRLYRDQDSPATGVVMFLVPRNRVKSIMRKSGAPIIQLTTDPRSQRSKGGKDIWHYEKTRKELKSKFRK